MAYRYICLKLNLGVKHFQAWLDSNIGHNLRLITELDFKMALNEIL